MVFVGFTAEESGLLGSQALVAQPTIPLSRVAAILNLDVMNLYGRTRDIAALGLDTILAGIEAGAPEGKDGFAFGVYPVNDERFRMVTYRGGGEYVYLVRVPEADLSVATLCNAYRGMWGYGPEVSRLYAAAGSGTDLPTDAVVSVHPAPTPTVEVPRAELERYVGEYRAREGPAFGQPFHISRPGRRARVHAPERRPSPCAAHRGRPL